MKRGQARPGAPLAYFDHLMTLDTDECLADWPFATNYAAGGYPNITLDGRHVNLHRRACELHHGPPPDDRPLALHSCHNKACLNPRHLRWGTYHENAMDKVEAGTSSRGERHHCARLTEADVRDIRARYRKGGPLTRQLADEYGVSCSQIVRIAVRESWAWLS